MKKLDIFTRSEISDDSIPKAVLVGIDDGTEDVELLLDELAGLLETAGGKEYARIVQKRANLDPKSCIGSGKLGELKAICNVGLIELVVFDNELSPSQIKNIEDALGDDIRVIDRSMLILDIFALHAVTGEGKLQVELAQLKYTVPRMFGKGLSMSRQGGGIIAMRGPGETKLETDKRHVAKRVAILEAQLREMERNREVRRKQRDKSGMMRVAIAGYTNAGKSTLLNYLTGAGILAENKLFATLDPTTRRYTLPSGVEILLTDTVGFIRKLPHQLINAFRSTLEEVINADLILIVADASSGECTEHLNVTKELLAELGAGDKPTIYLFNKCDLMSERRSERIIDMSSRDIIYISAKTGQGTESLIICLEKYASEKRKKITLELPTEQMGTLSSFYKNATVEEVTYTDSGVRVTLLADEKIRKKYAEYIVEK